MNYRYFLLLSSLITNNACVNAEKSRPITVKDIKQVHDLENTVKTEEITNIFYAAAKLKMEVTVVDGGIRFISYGGSGVVLRDAQEDDYYLFTAAHNVTHKKDYDIKDILDVQLTASKLPAKIVKYNRYEDLALLKVDGELDYLKGKIAKKANVGDNLVAIGYPNNKSKTIFIGELYNTSGWRFNAYFKPEVSKGVSGSGVYVVQNNQLSLMSIIITKNGDSTGMPSLRSTCDFLFGTPVSDDYCQPK